MSFILKELEHPAHSYLVLFETHSDRHLKLELRQIFCANNIVKNCAASKSIRLQNYFTDPKAVIQMFTWLLCSSFNNLFRSCELGW